MTDDFSRPSILNGPLLPVDAWEGALEALEGHSDCGKLPQWFGQNLGDAIVESPQPNVLIVRMASQLTREWLERKYRSILEEILSARCETGIEIRVESCAPTEGKTRRGSSRGKGSKEGRAEGSAQGSEPASHARVSKRGTVSPVAIRDGIGDLLQCTPMNPKYTFENFVSGSNSRFAYAAAQAVASAPGNSYNPLFIYGGVGLGKTHLMHAVGQEIQAREPDSVIAYLSGEAFTSSFVGAIRERKMDEFRRLYRKVDVWLVDDIQFIASKERTGEEFFHTFNALNDTNRQVVVCSDRPPHELQILDDRMISRFEAGLVTDIGLPTYETRLAILQKKLGPEGTVVPPEVLEMMARMIRSSVRVLEGALIRILAHASFTSSPINLQMATSLLSRHFDDGERAPVRMDVVQRVVCDSLEVPLEALQSKKRDRRSLVARQMAMYLCRELTDCSLQQIGQAFGGKDHSTVAHACRTFKQAMQSDANLDHTVSRVCERIRRSK